MCRSSSIGNSRAAARTAVAEEVQATTTGGRGRVFGWGMEPRGNPTDSGHFNHPEHRKGDTQQPPTTVSSQAVTHAKDPG